MRILNKYFSHMNEKPLYGRIWGNETQRIENVTKFNKQYHKRDSIYTSEVYKTT